MELRAALSHSYKLLVPYLAKKFRPFYGTSKFITIFTTARQLSVPRAR
jgi:hypothetical protein